MEKCFETNFWPLLFPFSW